MARAVSDIPVSRLVTHPTSPVRNSQPAGIGRLVAAGEVLVINNLGRNIEVSAVLSDILSPTHVFHQTAFPHEDEPSQFDLDIHGFLSGPDRRQLICVNHYGVIRLLAPVDRPVAFDNRSTGQLLELTSQRNLKWPGDAERFVFAGSCLLSSSPRGYAVDDAVQTGILISQRWERVIAGDSVNGAEPLGASDTHH